MKNSTLPVIGGVRLFWAEVEIVSQKKEPLYPLKLQSVLQESADRFMTGGMQLIQEPINSFGDIGASFPRESGVADAFVTGGGVAAPVAAQSQDDFVLDITVEPVMFNARKSTVGVERQSIPQASVQPIIIGEVEPKEKDAFGPVPQLTASSAMLSGQRYVPKELLGRGGMGQVWRALDCKTQGWVAVKRIHPELLQESKMQKRFQRECEILQQLQHPNIVRLLDSQVEQGFFVMELLEGQTLMAALRKRLRFSFADTILILYEVCKGLMHAHQYGLLHRDIKPSNIFFRGDKLEQVKLIDFGIAWAEQSTRYTTHQDGMLGTAYYMAPEILSGQGTPTDKVDVYSLGILTYELLTGELPVAGSSTLNEFYLELFEKEEMSTQECPQEIQSEFLRLVNNEFRELYRKAVARDPEKRCSLQVFMKGLREVYQMYSSLRKTGSARRYRDIYALLKIGKRHKAIRLLEEAKELYSKESKWFALQDTLNKEEKRLEGRAQLLRETWEEKRRQRSVRKRQSSLQALRVQWEGFAKSSPFPIWYEEHSLYRELQEPQRTLKGESAFSVGMWQYLPELFYLFAFAGVGYWAFTTYILPRVEMLSYFHHQKFPKTFWQLSPASATHSATFRKRTIVLKNSTRFKKGIQIRSKKSYAAGSGMLILEFEVTGGSEVVGTWGFWGRKGNHVSCFHVDEANKLHVFFRKNKKQVLTKKPIFYIQPEQKAHYQIRLSTGLAQFFVNRRKVAEFPRASRYLKWMFIHFHNTSSGQEQELSVKPLSFKFIDIVDAVDNLVDL